MGAGIIIAGWLHKLVSSRLGNAVSYNKSRKKEWALKQGHYTNLHEKHDMEIKYHVMKAQR